MLDILSGAEPLIMDVRQSGGSPADQLGGFFRSTTFMFEWGHRVVLANLKLCGYPAGEDVPLAEYLDRAPRHAPSPTLAFESLVKAVAADEAI
jgi:hypothetical protein